MIERKPKSNRRYLLYRSYVVLVYIGAAVFGVFWLLAFAANREPSTTQIAGFVVLFPLFGIAVFMLMGVSVFPFEYSVFGPLQRTGFPLEQPLLKRTRSWGRIASFNATIPFFTWYVYPSGLGISILGMGKVFIPNQYIRALKEERSFLAGSRYQVIHNSPEVQNPVYLPDSELFQMLRNVTERKSSLIHANSVRLLGGCHF